MGLLDVCPSILCVGGRSLRHILYSVWATGGERLNDSMDNMEHPLAFFQDRHSASFSHSWILNLLLIQSEDYHLKPFDGMFFKCPSNPKDASGDEDFNHLSQLG